MVELQREDAPSFKNFLRVDVALFRELLETVSPAIEPVGCNCRKPLPPGLKLTITLRHFATGDSYATLAYGFRVARNTIHYIIKSVSDAIVDAYADQLLTPPSTQEGWRDIASKFSTKWQFHHTLGSIDGKHVAIRKPPKSGSSYHNYKGFFSIVLLAIVDADYKFLWVHVGARGASSDAQIMSRVDLPRAIVENWLDLPPPQPLPHGQEPVPYFLIGDDAFGLQTWMMKPYSRKHLAAEELIFNYRLSRARRVVENAFGILANRFRCLLGKLEQRPHVVVPMVRAMCCLHNLLRDRCQAQAVNNGADDEEEANAWRDDVVPMAGLQHARANNAGPRIAREQRDELKGYYNARFGSVDWQWNACGLERPEQPEEP